MFAFLIILIVIAAVLLVVIVLAQNPKGGGLAQGFSASNQYMGVQNTNKFLNKATWSLVAFIGLASIISAVVISDGSSNDDVSDVTKAAKQEQQKAQKQAAPAANPFQSPIPAGE